MVHHAWVLSPILPSTHLLVTTRYRRSCYKVQGVMGNGCSHSNKLAPSIIQKKNECRKMWATFVHAIDIKLNVNWFWFVTENFGGKKKPTRIDLNLNSDLWLKKGKRNFNFQLEQKLWTNEKKEKKKKKTLKFYFFSFFFSWSKNLLETSTLNIMCDCKICTSKPENRLILIFIFKFRCGMKNEIKFVLQLCSKFLYNLSFKK